MSKLIRYCEGVMEAVWLAAIISVPLFLNFHGQRIESEKNHLLRSLAIGLAAAWVIKALFQAAHRESLTGRPSSQWTALLRAPLIAPAAILALLWMASTLLSLSPWVSFWGTPVRGSGCLTYLSCMAIFASIVATVRTQTQLNRIVSLVIITSLPISLYAVGQRFSIEPILWLEGTSTSRVGSTFGNPVYLGAYLVMVIPVTLSRVLILASSLRTEFAPQRIVLAQAALHGLILALQLLAILFTVSRGPWLGLMAGLSAMILMLGALWQKRWLVFATAGAGLIVLALLAGLALRGGTPSPTQAYEIQRLSELLNPQLGTGAERAAAWKAAGEAARFTEALRMDGTRDDSFSLLRLLAGYGPETVGIIGRLYSLSEFNAVLANHELFDRFHNDLWDTLLSMGMLGLAAYLALTKLVIYHGCSWLGLISSSRDKKVFWSTLLGGAILGSLGLAAWQGIGFLGLGLRGGSLLGALAFLAWVSGRKQNHLNGLGLTQSRALTLAGLLAGIIGHLLEIGFSFAIETTLLYFWIYAALLIVLGHFKRCAEHDEAQSVQARTSLAANSGKDDTRRRRHETKPNPGLPAAIASAWQQCRKWRAEIIAGLAAALVGSNLGVILIQKSEAMSAFAVMARALTHVPGNDAAASWILPIGLAFAGLVMLLALTLEGRLGTPNHLRRSGMAVLTVSALAILVYWLALANHTAQMIPFRDVRLENLEQFLKDRVFIVDFHYGFGLALILIMAFFLPESGRRSLTQSTPWTWLSSAASVIIILGAIYSVRAGNLDQSKAGIMEKLTREEFFQREEHRSITIAIHEAAIKQHADAESHYLALGKAYIDAAASAGTEDERRALFRKADRILEAGLTLRPLSPAFLIRRGNLYLRWGGTEPAPDEKRSLGRKAMDWYQKAAVLDPGNFALWNNMAYVELTLLGSLDEAQRSLLRSLELNPKSHPTHAMLGNLFFQKASATQDSIEKRASFRTALASFQQAVLFIGTNAPSTRYRYWVDLGATHFNLGEVPEAITAYQHAYPLSPAGEQWRNDEILARLYHAIQDGTNSLKHLERAIAMAPDNQRGSLVSLRDALFTRQPPAPKD